MPEGPDAAVARIISGDRRALAEAITLVESTRPDHQEQCAQLLNALPEREQISTRIGVTGAPGVGKSTLIEAMGMQMVRDGRRVAVLAIDPSSELHGGSILGDKTRMTDLARHPDAFVRSSPSSGTLGGLARRTREAITLCEAAGYSDILIETVGVGQSETAVAGVCDVFLLLVSPGGGDELQGIKRGIMELADIVVVTKGDGDLTHRAAQAVSEYRSALSFLMPRYAQLPSQVISVSAHSGDGIAALIEMLRDRWTQLQSAGLITQVRATQLIHEMWVAVQDGLIDAARATGAVSLDALEADVARGATSPHAAAAMIIQAVIPDASSA